MIKLNCKARNWHWGKEGLDSLVGRAYLNSVPSLIESKDQYEEADKERYAELWIGDHENGISELFIDKEDERVSILINDTEFIRQNQSKPVLISQIFKSNPERFLGKTHMKVFGQENKQYMSRMAFLLKLLAVDKAISIQAHPNQTLAEKLHSARPDIYKDETHKPEIGVALDDNVASCFGFLNSERLTKVLQVSKVLSKLFGFEENVTVVDETFLKHCIHKLFYEVDVDQECLTSIIFQLENEIHEIEESFRTEHQRLFLTLIDQYGRDDVGLLFIFFFNILRLKKGEALISIPDEPHAYLSGELVECMCNSDNTVRGGLTPKFKDTEILYEMLPYHNMEVERVPTQGKLIQQTLLGSTVTEYNSGFKEFRVLKIEIPDVTAENQVDGSQTRPCAASESQMDEIKLKFRSMSMMVVIKGKGSVEMPEFVPGNSQLNTFEINANCAYYVMPESEIIIRNEQLREQGPLVIFIANSDI